MLEVIKIPKAIQGEDLFFLRMDGCDGDEGVEVNFFASKDELGQFAGDCYNWDDGEPYSYTYEGNLEDLFEIIKSKSKEDESADWIEEYI